MSDVLWVFQGDGRSAPETLNGDLLAKGLSDALTDTHEIIAALHGYHWNTSYQDHPDFSCLTELQFAEMSSGAEQLAKRIAELGHDAPEMNRSNRAANSTAMQIELPDLSVLLSGLARKHEMLAGSLGMISGLAQESGDLVTYHLAAARAKSHEKAASDLRSAADS